MSKLYISMVMNSLAFNEFWPFDERCDPQDPGNDQHKRSGFFGISVIIVI